MSFQLSISVEEKTDSLLVFDCNKEEWGEGRNPRIEDITSSILEIITPTPDMPVIVPSGNPLTQVPPQPAQPQVFNLDVTGNFPNKEGDAYEVLPYMVGQGDNSLESGIWKVKLTVIGVDKFGKSFTKTASVTEVFVKKITCCVDKLGKHINANALNDKKQQLIIELNNLVESMCDSKDCGLTEQADGIIRLLKSQCECAGC